MQEFILMSIKTKYANQIFEYCFNGRLSKNKTKTLDKI